MTILVCHDENDKMDFLFLVHVRGTSSSEWPSYRVWSHWWCEVQWIHSIWQITSYAFCMCPNRQIRLELEGAKVVLFVSPELSSGRDLVIQMSVRRAVCGVRRPPSMFFCPEHNLGNRLTYRDDIWYVGGARSEVAHAESWAWQMPIKYLICIIYAKICPEHFSGTVCPT